MPTGTKLAKHIVNSALNTIKNDSTETEDISPNMTKTTFKGPNARKSALHALAMKGLKKATAE